MPDVSRPPVVTVYVLKGSTGRRYIGITNDLSRRLREHRAKKTKGGQILEEFRVLYREQFPDHNMAREREKFLKSGQGRKWLDELESKTGPARRVKQSPQGGLCASGTFDSPHLHQLR